METESILVRRATKDDEALAREAIIEIHERPVRQDMSVRAFLEDADCYLMLATQEGHVVGSLYGYALRRADRVEPQFLLYGIDVREEFRGRGIGRALVNAFLDQARLRNAFEVWVLTDRSNEAAIATYARCGFTLEGVDTVMMVKRLNRKGPASV